MTNLEIGYRIATARKDHGMTMEELAQAVSVARSTIQRYETGKIEKIKLPVIESIANALGVNPAWIIGKSGQKNKATDTGSFSSNIIPFDASKRIPILGRIAAGLPILAEQNIEGYTTTDLNGGAVYFGLRVKGDSMNAARINEGDVLIVRQQSEVENGQIAVVMVNGSEATVKRFYQTDNTVTLMPQSTNPEHRPQIYNTAETQVRVIGLVVKNEITF